MSKGVVFFYGRKVRYNGAMKPAAIHILAGVSLSLFLFILLHSFYIGISTYPTELDSVMYHIPIAKSYLDGRIFSSPDSPILHRFFPGASEGILALFILFRIPLNLFNVLGATVLACGAYLLGKRAGLDRDESVLFSTGFASVTAISRWLNVQIIDIWVVAYYAFLMCLVLKPEKKVSYFLKLGIVLGMFVGSKYSAPLYAGILFLFFGRGIVKKINIKNTVVLIMPVLIIGGFWYLRNYLVMKNPLYPIAIPGFPGVKNWALELPVWKAVAAYPASIASALISEYLLWSGVVFVAPAYIIRRLIMKQFNTPALLMLLGMANLAAYLLLPNGESYRVHVSNLRYSYPVFLPLVLAAFVWVKSKRESGWIAVMSVSSLFFSLQVGYHPKLLFVFILMMFFLWKKWGLETPILPKRKTKQVTD